LDVKECVIVEDSPKDLDSASQSGASVYEVSGYHEVTLENILNKINYFNYTKMIYLYTKIRK
tara:strand:+ start:146 stop:331 length:186 start_codon:yes stop_codon:yes gene_type:complete